LPDFVHNAAHPNAGFTEHAMASTKKMWKKGRGALGALDPLLGVWRAEADSPKGRIACSRRFSRILGGGHVLLEARWALPDKVYEEHALFGADDTGLLRFWSFTSGGKRSEGSLVAAPDIHPEAIAFEAQMPAGLARMAYWPNEAGGFNWAVESRTKKGWNRFTLHHYLPEAGS
jgi:hypothetical protein